MRRSALLVSAIGYTPAQVVTRLLTVAAYALVLPPLFGVFALSALDAAVVVMSMALIGQDIVGGEWLFSGYEAKVAAYILVLAALRLVLVRERLATATLLFAAATYFHFLVGGFWFAAGMALRLVDAPRNLTARGYDGAAIRAPGHAAVRHDRLVPVLPTLPPRWRRTCHHPT